MSSFIYVKKMVFIQEIQTAAQALDNITDYVVGY